MGWKRGGCLEEAIGVRRGKFVSGESPLLDSPLQGVLPVGIDVEGAELAVLSLVREGFGALPLALAAGAGELAVALLGALVGRGAEGEMLGRAVEDEMAGAEADAAEIARLWHPRLSPLRQRRRQSRLCLLQFILFHRRRHRHRSLLVGRGGWKRSCGLVGVFARWRRGR